MKNTQHTMTISTIPAGEADGSLAGYGAVCSCCGLVAAFSVPQLAEKVCAEHPEVMAWKAKQALRAARG